MKTRTRFPLNDKAKELLTKLQALAERGVGGEKETAQRMFERALIKYGITLEDIQQEEFKEYYFKTSTKRDKILLVQIARSVRHDMRIFDVRNDSRGNTSMILTPAEYIQIDQMFHVYSVLYRKELEVFYIAFLTANDLLVNLPSDQRKSVEELTDEEYDMWYRANGMAASVKKETIRKQLGK